MSASARYLIMGHTLSTDLKHGIHEVSATKHYELGTQLTDIVSGDIYRYAKAGMTMLTNRFAWGKNAQITGHDAIGATSAKGENSISVTVAATDGIAGDGVIAVNYLVDGYVCIWHSDASVTQFRITSNSVGASGSEMIVGLDDELPEACTAATETAEIMANPFIDVRSGNSGGYKPFLGVPMGPATSTLCYHWLKRRGPAFVDPQAAVGLALGQAVVIRHDGSIDLQDDSDAYAQHAQRAGYVLSYIEGGATQAAPFIYVMLE